MSEENQVVDGVQPNQDSVEGVENKVAYESFQRVLDEKKRTQSENEALKQKLAQIENEKLEHKGNLEEALTNYKQQLEAKESELRQVKTTFATNQINSKIESALAKKGCKNPAKAIRLMEDVDYQALIQDVDDNLNPSENTLNFILDKFQKENDFLFGKPAPRIADGVPGGTKPSTPESEKAKAIRAMKEAKTQEEYEKAKAKALTFF